MRPVEGLWLTLLFVLVTVCLCGCGRGKASARVDAMELERAFALEPGPKATGETGTVALAANAVAAIRAEDWPKAISQLAKLRTTKGLTAQQSEAVHNANGNAYVRLVEQAGNGNAEAKAALATLSNGTAGR